MRNVLKMRESLVFMNTVHNNGFLTDKSIRKPKTLIFFKKIILYELDSRNNANIQIFAFHERCS